MANYNLICLSSVIPPGSRIVRERYRTPPESYGQRLCVVMSQMRESRPGCQAHAGVAWVQQEAAGQGPFVELHDSDRERLVLDLRSTLDSMQLSHRVDLGPVHSNIGSATCTEDPVCALVIAAYGSQPW